MKTQQFFQSLTQKLTFWRRQYKVRHCHIASSKTSRKDGYPTARVSRSINKSLKDKNGLDAVGSPWVKVRRSCVVFVIAVVSITGVMGQKLYNQPQLQVGTVAPQTIRAPATAKIENKKKTAEKRKAATNSSLPVLMVDERINAEIEQNLQQILQEGNEIRATVGSFPFFDTLVLSVSTQRYLRSCSNWEWQALLLAVESTDKQKSRMFVQKRGSQRGHKDARTQRNEDAPKVSAFASPYHTPSTSKEASGVNVLASSGTSQQPPVSGSYAPKTEDLKSNDLFQNIDFAQAVAQLQAYRLISSKQNLSSVIAQITKIRQGYAQAKTKLTDLVIAKPETVYDEASILNLSDEDWTKIKIEIQQSLERILTQGISPGLPQNILQNTVSIQVQTFVPKDAEPLASKLLLAVLKPNLKKDELQTQRISAKIAAQVEPVIVTVYKGEVIVRQQQKVSAWNFDVLEHYHLIEREIHWLGLIQLGSVVTASVAIFAMVEGRIKHSIRQSDRLLVLLLSLSVPLVQMMGTPYTTWSAVGLLLGSFYGPTLGVTVVGLLSLLLPMSLEISLIALVAGVSGGVLGSCVAQRLRSREELALLSLAIALTEGAVYLIIKLLISAVLGVPVHYLVLQNAGLFALSGLVWSIVGMGLSPYLEKLFDLVTPIRLAELANPNRLLLKRLATETPGTFQHTLFVATLAEAAAKQLGCNVELVRAGTLYHDIGKIHDPMAFIENQMGGPNKHDTEIKDPWMSAYIIKKHVSEGLAIARKYSLPSSVQAFIPEHQGTMQIAYFYHQAKQMALLDPSLKVMEADFRYDGPIPQSRETAIVMLADSCEAALRSLTDATREQALAMLNNILRARWQDNQMVDSGLTREEMTQIAEIFVQVWQQFHHKRIAYPKLNAAKEGTGNRQ
ncbi:HD family phosphohydrolase [Brasilonema bromeliae]|uniref:Phosphohydrolase n=1 Tax=Brasilonema bromeliae SPC951 TaxID=385972 RepID=A0ABX1PB47_9CYAN|nr:HDIG domain-containing metalloprotein [Brasilonema bromeliae]NMG21689.1 phosphohydrolase [Brasilonema bromeliae SPC951]